MFAATIHTAPVAPLALDLLAATPLSPGVAESAGKAQNFMDLIAMAVSDQGPELGANLPVAPDVVAASAAIAPQLDGEIPAAIPVAGGKTGGKVLPVELPLFQPAPAAVPQPGAAAKTSPPTGIASPPRAGPARQSSPEAAAPKRHPHSPASLIDEEPEDALRINATGSEPPFDETPAEKVKTAREDSGAETNTGSDHAPPEAVPKLNLSIIMPIPGKPAPAIAPASAIFRPSASIASGHAPNRAEPSLPASAAPDAPAEAGNSARTVAMQSLGAVIQRPLEVRHETARDRAQPDLIVAIPAKAASSAIPSAAAPRIAQLPTEAAPAMVLTGFPKTTALETMSDIADNRFPQMKPSGEPNAEQQTVIAAQPRPKSAPEPGGAAISPRAPVAPVAGTEHSAPDTQSEGPVAPPSPSTAITMSAELQPAFAMREALLPAVVSMNPGSESIHHPSSATEPHDLAALVDRLFEARDAARSAHPAQTVESVIVHADFGRVSVRIEQETGGLSVSLASSDPEFASVAQTAAGQLAGQSETPPQRQDNPGQSAGSQSTGSASGNQSEGQPRPSLRSAARDGSAQPERAFGPDDTPVDQPSRRKAGIFA